MTSTSTSSTKTALVTGASGGIGQAIAEQFARDRTNLVIVARNTTQLETHAMQWRQQYGVQVTVLGSDLAQVGAAQALADQVQAQGIKIDYLVNNPIFPSYPTAKAGGSVALARFLTSAEKISATIYRTNACHLCRAGN